LLIRVTRNCPWNRCTFCPVYKGARFSVRPVDHLKADIDAVYRHVCALRESADDSGGMSRDRISELARSIEPEEAPAFTAAFNWLLAGGMKSIFLQDADSLVIKPADLVDILTHLIRRFPAVERITSYSRSRTVAHRKDDDLKAIRDSGLSRIHIGLESGCDQVLALVRKGSTKQTHITAGLKAKQAGFELSEYVMPGLGGRELSRVHALETADALNRIDPHFIRLRTLAVPDAAPLGRDCREGRFAKCTDIMVAEELLTFIEHLDGITSVVKSDHILNLFADLEGTLPGDREPMLEILRSFLALEPQSQRLYRLGRRLGVFGCLRDLEDPRKLAWVEDHYRQMNITAENIDQTIEEIMKGYV